VDNGEGVPISQADYGVWEHRELPPHRGPGQSSDRKRIWLLYCCECYTQSFNPALITVQNLVTVSHVVRAHVTPKNFLAR